MSHPGLSAGFRPFFLAAALLAATFVPVWAVTYLGLVDLGPGIQRTWHGHELIFGYLLAVLAGFLTIRSSGLPLFILVGIWILGRATVYVQPAHPVVAAAFDLSFIPCLIAIKRPALWAVPKWPNGLFLPLLLGFWAVNLVYHLAATGLLSASELHAVAVDLASLLLVVVAGRLIPGYTGAALKHIRPPRTPAIEAASVILLIATALLHIASYSTAAGLCLLLVGALQGWRMLAWRSWQTRHHPPLWILHLGYAWLVLGLCLRGIGDIAPGLFSASIALHAITAGAIGSLTVGMMTRITLIHAKSHGAPGPMTTVVFVLVQLAAVLRVAPTAVAENPAVWIGLAAVAWSLAFLLWLVCYARILLGRPDLMQSAPT
jgi:uncharacterized protein involved in response to NO